MPILRDRRAPDSHCHGVSQELRVWPGAGGLEPDLEVRSRLEPEPQAARGHSSESGEAAAAEVWIPSSFNDTVRCHCWTKGPWLDSARQSRC